MKYRKQIEEALELAENALKVASENTLNTEVTRLDKVSYLTLAGSLDAIILSLQDILKDDADD